MKSGTVGDIDNTTAAPQLQESLEVVLANLSTLFIFALLLLLLFYVRKRKKMGKKNKQRRYRCNDNRRENNLILENMIYKIIF